MTEHQFDTARETMGYPDDAELEAPLPPTITDPVCSDIAKLIDVLQSEDVNGLANEDQQMMARLKDVSVLFDRLDAERLRLLRAAELSGVLERDGYANPSVWLRKATNLTAAEATRRGRVTHRLTALPELAAAHAAGTIGTAHMSELDRLAVHVGIDNVAAVQRPLLVAATQLRDVAEFSKMCTGWRHAFEADYLDERDNDNWEKRRAGLSILNGRGHLWGDFDAEATALIKAAITACTTLDGPDTPDDAYRTPAQRTADAITDMAARILDQGDAPVVAGVRPHVNVRITAELIAGMAAAHYAEIDGIGAVGRATALRLLGDSSLTRILCDNRSQPLDVGTSTRTWPTGLRKAITERDHHCRFPGCDRPPQYCDIDHIHQVEDGGPTSLNNGILLCRTHHRVKHPSRWWPTLHPDGTITWTNPNHPERITHPQAYTRQWVHTLLNWPRHDQDDQDNQPTGREHDGPPDGPPPDCAAETPPAYDAQRPKSVRRHGGAIKHSTDGHRQRHGTTSGMRLGRRGEAAARGTTIVMDILFPTTVEQSMAYDFYRPDDVRAEVLRINMVASVDGRITDKDGRSDGLGGEGDLKAFRAQRALADAILVGAGTARAESYGPHKIHPSVAGRRREDGHTDPAAIVLVSGSLQFDLDAPLFTEAVTQTIVITSEASPPERRRSLEKVADIIVAGTDDVDLTAALADLRDRGLSHILCEGGPSLNAALLEQGLVDELCLTIAPLIGLLSDRHITDLVSDPSRLQLLGVAQDDDELFLRYGSRR